MASIKNNPKSEKDVIGDIQISLKKSKRPLFFFHDDPDGFCSFLILRQYFDKGYGVIVKSKPLLDSTFFNKIDEQKPDLIVTLDLALVSQEFIDYCHSKDIDIINIDHHDISLSKGFLHYYNPKFYDKKDTTACASLCFKIAEYSNELMWLAGIGTISDWQTPFFYDDLIEKYPECFKSNKFEQMILDKIKEKNIKVYEYFTLLKKPRYRKKSPEFLLFSTSFGYLSKVMSFALKGQMHKVKKSIAAYTHIKNPDGFFDTKIKDYNTKLVVKRSDEFFDDYVKLFYEALKEAKKSRTKDILTFIYVNKNSYTGDLSNNLYYYFKDQFLIIGRLKDDLYRLSVRYKGNAKKAVAEAIEGLDAAGGGHEHACGLSVSKNHFNDFVKKIKKIISK